MGEQTKKLLSLLKGKLGKLKLIKEKYNTSFIFLLLVEVGNSEKPAIYLSGETNRFLGELEAESAIDIYFYS